LQLVRELQEDLYAVQKHVSLKLGIGQSQAVDGKQSGDASRQARRGGEQAAVHVGFVRMQRKETPRRLQLGPFSSERR